jgi:sec-independent protein translocase protein TatA
MPEKIFSPASNVTLRHGGSRSDYSAGRRVHFFNCTTMTSMFLFLGNLGASELMIIFIIVLLLFGGNKIPELMRGLGRGIREFNNAKNSVEDEIRQGMRDAEKKSIDSK